MKRSIIALFMVFSAIMCKSQTVRISRIGHDRIVITNTGNFSLRFKENDQTSSLILYPDVPYEFHFPLTYSHVYYTPFSLSYDRACFLKDSLLCSDRSLSEQEYEIRWRGLEATLLVYLQGTKAGEGIDIIRFLLCPWMDNCDEVLYELTRVYNSSDTDVQKRERFNAIMEAVLRKHLQKIHKDELSCIESSKRVFESGSFPSKIFYLNEYIPLNEKWRLEFSPYVSPIFNVSQFKGIKGGNTFVKSDFFNDPTYGFRCALNFNAYKKNGQRKFLVNYYIPIEISKTSTISRTIPDSIFSPSKGYGWLIYSAGFGFELTIRSIARPNRRFTGGVKLLADFGISSNSCFQRNIDNVSKKPSGGRCISNFSGVAPYINVGMKIQLLKWLDLFVAYHATVFYSSVTKDMPTSGQLNVGANFNLYRHNSFQY